MAVDIHANKIVVFKFESTGLVELFREVVDLANDPAGYPSKYTNFETGRYNFNEQHRTHEIIFDRIG